MTLIRMLLPSTLLVAGDAWAQGPIRHSRRRKMGRHGIKKQSLKLDGVKTVEVDVAKGTGVEEQALRAAGLDQA